MRRRERSPRRGADIFEPDRGTANREPAACPKEASHRPGGAKQSAHWGGGVRTPRAGAAHAAHPAAGADGPVGKPACLHARGSAAAPMSFFPPPQKPLPEGYPLPAIDAYGVAIRQGAMVRILTIPQSLTHDLPAEEVARLKAVERTVMRVLEIDAYGHVWFGEFGPWFSLRPNEVAVQADEK